VAAVESDALPDDIAMYIASAIKANVRELEGALIRLAAYASLSKHRIDVELAQETLGAAITRGHGGWAVLLSCPLRVAAATQRSRPRRLDDESAPARSASVADDALTRARKPTRGG
jgi:hypothetical protein